MRKVGVETTIDLDTGEYNVTVKNISEPGKPVEYHELKNALNKVFSNWENKVKGKEPEDSTAAVH